MVKLPGFERELLERRFYEVIPGNFHNEIPLLVSIIEAKVQGLEADLTEEDQSRMIQLITSIMGSKITAGDSLVMFGDKGNFGDITIGSVVGGNVINFNVSMSSSSKKNNAKSESQHSKRLLETHIKRLKILEEQAAAFGLHCPPHILIEIDTIKEKIKELQSN